MNNIIYSRLFILQRKICGVKHVDYKKHRAVFTPHGLNTNKAHVHLKSQSRHGINSKVFFYVE